MANNLLWTQTGNRGRIQGLLVLECQVSACLAFHELVFMAPSDFIAVLNHRIGIFHGSLGRNMKSTEFTFKKSRSFWCVFEESGLLGIGLWLV